MEKRLCNSSRLISKYKVYLNIKMYLTSIYGKNSVTLAVELLYFVSLYNKF